MAGNIDMVPDKVPMGLSRESTIQDGGGSSGIDMVGGDMPFPMKHTPVSSVQKSGGSSGIDMVGTQNLLDKTPADPYSGSFGSDYPSDKGES